MPRFFKDVQQRAARQQKNMLMKIFTGDQIAEMIGICIEQGVTLGEFLRQAVNLNKSYYDIGSMYKQMGNWNFYQQPIQSYGGGQFSGTSVGQFVGTKTVNNAGNSFDTISLNGGANWKQNKLDSFIYNPPGVQDVGYLMGVEPAPASLSKKKSKHRR